MEKYNDRLDNTSNWENFEMGERGKGKKGGERNAHVRTKKGPLGENGYDPAINEIENEFPEEPWGVNFTASGAEPPKRS